MKKRSIFVAIAMAYATFAILHGAWAANGGVATDGHGSWQRPEPVVGLICTWSAYSTYDESIVIDLSDRVAYWVNQNRPLSIHQLNAGRVVLSGVRDGVRVSKKRVEKEVPVRMIIDRISGAFFVQQKVFRQAGPGRCERSRLF